MVKYSLLPSFAIQLILSFVLFCWLYWEILLNITGVLTLKLAGGIYGLKFLPLNQLPNAFAQLFLDNADIF